MFKAHNKLGRFCKEKQYGDLLELLLKNSKISYKREVVVDFQNKDGNIGGNRVDFIIDDKILLEIKAKSLILKEDYFQVQRYLQASNLKLGLIVNFRQRYLKPKRIINFNLKPPNTNNTN